MQKNSNSDYDGQTSQLVSLKLGKFGLDLRSDDTVITTLADLRNAKFTDEEIVERRSGHTGKILQDQAQMVTGSASVFGNWLYGHGTLVQKTNTPLSVSTFHYPVCSQHLSTFNYNGNDVSWTGDRLLIHESNLQNCLGSSTYWSNALGFVITRPHGIPCFQPSQVDYTPPVKITGAGNNAADTVVNAKYRVVVYISGGVATAQVVSRETNAVVSVTALSSTTNNANPRVILSAGLFVAFWTDLTTGVLYKASWNGTSWSTENSIATAAAYDVENPAGDTYYVVYRNAANVRIRAYVGNALQSAPIVPDTLIANNGTGAVATTTAIDSNVSIAYQTSSGVSAVIYNSLGTLVDGPVALYAGASTIDSITVSSGAVPDSSSNLVYTCYVGCTGGTGQTAVRTATYNTFSTVTSVVKWGCSLLSRAFRVGNEVFVWLKSGNTNLAFLTSGPTVARVSGYSDRGETATPTLTSNRTLPGVNTDPLNPYVYTWAHAITTVSNQQNRVKYSDINFLPQITTAQYGNSVYISGSAVSNFDGYECSDAGFQEYPIVTGGVAASSGSLSAGAYSIRAYIVRYNNKGEKFISPALTSTNVTATSSQKITWTIKTVQSCTTSDAIIEIYRTAANGTTYNYEGYVANDQTLETVTFVSTLADSAIAVNPGDAYQAQIGGQAELQNWGPIGCSILVSANDRLWGAGGQVPFGRVQFSKLKTDLYGAGFDAIGGFSTVDSEGGAVTSIGNIGSQMVIFEADKFYAIDGSEGPDNYGRGGFPAAKFAAAKGAKTHFGTILTDAGLVYWNECGPLIIGNQFAVTNISDNVRTLAVTLTPTGVKLNANNQEVVWYTKTGTALLWDYKYGSRWAIWDNLYINAASSTALASVDGLLLKEDSSVYTDAGSHYTFRWKTSQLRIENLMQGYMLLRRYGLTGTFKSAHTLNIRVFYNGSPLWEESEVWVPQNDTYLQSVSDFGDLTAAQVDALGILDKSGNYGMHRRAKRQNCQRFQIEVLDNAPNGPSYIPQTIEFELAARPGFGRSAVTTFTDK